MPIKKHRANGAIGAILDEYEQSILTLKLCIDTCSPETLTKIVDHETKDEDCRSIQTILSHVVESGYTYVIEIRKWLNDTVDYKAKETYFTVQEYQTALDIMFDYTLKLFKDYPNLKLENHEPNHKIKVRWGQLYDVEQLFEHAIVHIMRHRRQIEIFKAKLEH